MTTRSLITGGAGMSFIGGGSARRKAGRQSGELRGRRGRSVHRPCGEPAGTARELQVHQDQRERLRRHLGDHARFQFDYVFHYAACVGVQRTLRNPVQVLCDIDGIKHVLGLAKNTGVRRVFYSSSSEVYGEPVEFPQNEETTPLNSKLPYAVVKNVGESFLRSYKREYRSRLHDFPLFQHVRAEAERGFRDDEVHRGGAGWTGHHGLWRWLAVADILLHRRQCRRDRQRARANKCVNEVVNIGNEVEVSVLELAQAGGRGDRFPVANRARRRPSRKGTCGGASPTSPRCGRSLGGS